MLKSLQIIIACSIWCVIAALGSQFFALKTNSLVPGFLLSVLCPVVACYQCGLRHPGYLFKVGLYAAIGWLLPSLIMPVVSSRSIDPMRILEYTVAVSIFSAFFAIPGAWAIPLKEFGYQKPEKKPRTTQHWERANDDPENPFRPPEEF